MLVLWNVEWVPVGLVDGVEQFLYFYRLYKLYGT